MWKLPCLAFSLLVLGCADSDEEIPEKAAEEEKVELHAIVHHPIWEDSLGGALAAITLVDEALLQPRVRRRSEVTRQERVERDARVFYSVQVESAAALERLLDRLEVAPGRLLNVSVDALPEDLGALPVPRKKEAFFRALLPLVVFNNTIIASHRTRLQHLQGRGAGVLDEEEQLFLREMIRYYSLERHREALLTRSDTLQALLERADRIPRSLVLAQAAIESGWGSSRFSRQGNNLFGQRVWTGELAGLAPEQLEGARFTLAMYPTIGTSVRSYMRNLNTHPAYEEFRRRRGDTFDPLVLAGTLKRYSVRGQDYVDDILRLIRQNRLARFEETVRIEPFSPI